MQQRESAKKAAAAAVVAGKHQPSSGNATQHHMEVHTHASVTKTASWLDRASTLLSNRGAEVENQIKEVQALIHEGVVVQRTSAGLPRLLETGVYGRIDDSPLFPTGVDPNSFPTPTTPQHAIQEKTPQRSRSTNFLSTMATLAAAAVPTPTAPPPGSEDVEALFGFLSSVRQENAGKR